MAPSDSVLSADDYVVLLAQRDAVIAEFQSDLSVLTAQLGEFERKVDLNGSGCGEPLCADASTDHQAPQVFNLPEPRPLLALSIARTSAARPHLLPTPNRFAPGSTAAS